MPAKLERKCICGASLKKYYFGRFKSYSKTCGKKECKIGCSIAARNRVYKAKECENCKISFVPVAHNQKVCKKCLPEKAFLYRKYGIDAKKYEEIVNRNNGKCEICMELKAECIDHCHKTGKIRGYICYRCNRDLYPFDNLEQAEKIFNYLKKYAP